MASVPGHCLGKIQHCLDCVEQAAIPMVFQPTPDALDRVVLAVIGWVVGQVNSDLELVDRFNNPFHKLCATAVIFPSVVLIDQ
jgi:hypothetical protein